MLKRWPDVVAIKIISCLLLSMIILFLNKVALLVTLFIFIIILLLISGIRWQQLKPFVIVSFYTGIIIMAMHVLMHSPHSGIIVVLQMSSITMLSCFLINTSREFDLIYAAENFLRPLKKIGIDAEKLTLSLFLAVRSIHLLTRQYREIRFAQQARGLEKNIFAIIVPLLIKSFQSAQHLVDALYVKGYEIE